MSDEKQFSDAEIQAALEIVHSEYFSQVAAILSLQKDPKTLSYVKVPMTTPSGGNYLVSILHIDGPVLDLAKLKEMAEVAEKGK